MKLKNLGVFLFIALLVLAGSSAMLYTHFRLKAQQTSEFSPDIKKIERAKGETITLTETQNGNRKWVLKMNEVKYSKDNNTAHMSKVQGLVYGDKKGDTQEVLFTFEAPAGTYFKDKNHVYLTDGAKMVSPSAKIIIMAPNMDWSSQTNTVNASGGVKMRKEHFGESSANKAVFAMDFSKIQFLGQATSVLGSPPNTRD